MVNNIVLEKCFSCTTYFPFVRDSRTEPLDNRKLVDAMYVDLSKTSINVPHKHLLKI